MNDIALLRDRYPTKCFIRYYSDCDGRITGTMFCANGCPDADVPEVFPCDCHAECVSGMCKTKYPQYCPCLQMASNERLEAFIYWLAARQTVQAEAYKTARKRHYVVGLPEKQQAYVLEGIRATVIA